MLVVKLILWSLLYVPATGLKVGVATVPLTDIVNAIVAVVPSGLVWVTVYLVDALVAVGVPLITPVLASRTKPVGSAGLTVYLEPSRWLGGLYFAACPELKVIEPPSV